MKALITIMNDNDETIVDKALIDPMPEVKYAEKDEELYRVYKFIFHYFKYVGDKENKE